MSNYEARRERHWDAALSLAETEYMAFSPTMKAAMKALHGANWDYDLQEAYAVIKADELEAEYQEHVAERAA